MTNILIANFGNDSIALIEWAKQQALPSVHVVSVETGWAAPHWTKRVVQAQTYVEAAGFSFIRVNSPLSFTNLARERRNFPSIKFHWCAKFLKALPILDYLDEIDPAREATLLFAKRRSQAQALQNLPEFIAESPLLGHRKVWHPLYQHALVERNALIAAAGFDLLDTRSLECDPCIYNQQRDNTRIELASLSRLQALEAEIGKPMFPATQVFENKDLGADERDIYFSGCGSEFGCGE